MWNQPQHSYEEIRRVVVDILVGASPPNQWTSLMIGVAEKVANVTPGTYPTPSLHPRDEELVRDAFWDLFRLGFITLGSNNSNPNWPWFRLSHFGQQTLKANRPLHFHDTTSFLTLVAKEVPDISSEAVQYLDEAVAAFYAECRLAACIMLGVAAEAEFQRLIDVAIQNAAHGGKFASIQKEKFIRQKITKFAIALKPLIPLFSKAATEDLDTNLSMVQSVLRVAPNDAGHPPLPIVPEREQVYVYLQLFIPFARQIMRLRQELK
jgi:hypothetical protein